MTDKMWALLGGLIPMAIEFIVSSVRVSIIIDVLPSYKEEEKEMNKVQSTTAWQRAATESSAHSRLGSVLGLYAHELSGGSGKMTWEEKHTLRLTLVMGSACVADQKFSICIAKFLLFLGFSRWWKLLGLSGVRIATDFAFA